MEHAFLEPRAGGPRLRFCAPLLAVEGANNLISHSLRQQGLLLSQPGLRGARGPLPLGKNRETREMEVAPALNSGCTATRGRHRTRGKAALPSPLLTD